jgi:hypothetical protein
MPDSEGGFNRCTGFQQFISDFRRIPAERHSNPLHRSKQIHQQWGIRTSRILEQEGGSAFGDNALRYFSGFEDGVDFRAHALQLLVTFKIVDKALQISERHSG